MFQLARHELTFQEEADVAVLEVARSVTLVGRRHEVGSRAFGHDDQRMMAFQQAAVQFGQQSSFTFEFERRLGHQGEVDLLAWGGWLRRR